MTNTSLPYLKSIPNCSRVQVIRREFYDSYIGTQDDLVTAGLAINEMFPVWPKRKTSYISNPLDGFNRWTITRIKGHRFKLRFDHEYKPITKRIFTVDDYKAYMMRFLSTSESIIHELITGNAKDFEGFTLNNSHELLNQLTRTFNSIRNAGVVTKENIVRIK